MDAVQLGSGPIEPTILTDALQVTPLVALVPVGRVATSLLHVPAVSINSSLTISQSCFTPNLEFERDLASRILHRNLTIACNDDYGNGDGAADINLSLSGPSSRIISAIAPVLPFLEPPGESDGIGPNTVAADHPRYMADPPGLDIVHGLFPPPSAGSLPSPNRHPTEKSEGPQAERPSIHDRGITSRTTQGNKVTVNSDEEKLHLEPSASKSQRYLSDLRSICSNIMKLDLDGGNIKPSKATLSQLVYLLESSKVSLAEMKKVTVIGDTASLLDKLSCDLNVNRSQTSMTALVQLSDELQSSVLSEIDRSVTACRAVLLVFVAGAQDKDLSACPQKYLSAVMTYTQGILQDLILPLTSPIAVASTLSSVRSWFKPIHRELRLIIKLLDKFYQLSDSPDRVDPAVEYVASEIIFSECVATESSSVFGLENVRSLQLAATNLECTIFALYTPGERVKLLDQNILHRIATLSIRKSRVHRYKLLDGGSIQLVSVLLMRLIHCTGIGTPIEPLLESITDQKNVDLLKGLTSRCISASEMGSTMAQHIGHCLILRASKLSKTSTDPDRALLTQFTQDFLQVLEDPEWPAAAVLLNEFLLELINIATDSNESSKSVVFAVELIGEIALRLLPLRQRRTHPSRSSVTDGSANESSILQSMASIDEVLCSLKLVLLQLQRTPQMDAAQDFLASTFAGKLLAGELQEEGEVRFEHVSSILGCLSTADAGMSLEQDDVKPSIQAAYSKLLQQLPIADGYNLAIRCMLFCLNSDRNLVISRVEKSLTDLIDQDLSIFDVPGFKDALADLTVHSSSLVRERALFMRGRYIERVPSAVAEQYISICSRCVDSKSNVRKEALRRLRVVYTLTDDVEVRCDILKQLCARLDDVEDGVNQIAVDGLSSLWIEPLINVPQGNTLASIAARTPVLETVVCSLLLFCEKIDTKAALIRDAFQSIVGPLANPPPNYLAGSQLLASELHRRAVEEEDSSTGATSGDPHDEPYACESADVPIPPVHHTVHHNQSSRLSLLILASLIAADGSLLSVDQLGALQKYLKREGQLQPSDSQSLVLEIMRDSLKSLSVADSSFLETLEGSLCSTISTLSTRSLPMAVSCLWEVSLLREDTRRVSSVLKTCMGMLQNGQPKRAAAMQLLHITGNILRYCDVDSMAIGPQEAARVLRQSAIGKDKRLDINQVRVSPLYRVVLVLLRYTDAPFDEKVRRVAVRSVGIACIGNPKLFVMGETLKLLDGIMKREGIDAEKLMVMRIIYDHLTNEERQADLKSVVKDVPQKSMRVGNSPTEESAGGGGASLHGQTENTFSDSASPTLISRYILQILSAATELDPEYSLASVRLLDKALQKGLAHPLRCIGTVVSLEGSPFPEVEVTARMSHSVLYVKQAKLIQPSYIEAIRRATEYLSKIESSGLGNDHGMLKVLDSVYSKVKGTVTTRQTFERSLFDTLDFDPMEADFDAQRHLEYIRLLVPGLANLRFETADELYHLVYSVDSVMSTTGFSVSGEVRNIKRQEHDPPERTLVTLSAASTILLALSRLRKYVMSAYGLNEERCREFNPHASTRDRTRISLDSEKPGLDLQDLEFKLPLYSSAYCFRITTNLVDAITEDISDKDVLESPSKRRKTQRPSHRGDNDMAFTREY